MDYKEINRKIWIAEKGIHHRGSGGGKIGKYRLQRRYKSVAYSNTGKIDTNWIMEEKLGKVL